MDGTRIFKSKLSICRSPWEEGYDLDEMNAKGAFNHSRLQIVKASAMVEPVGWYSSREYYVVTKGLSVGIFHDLSEVNCSVDPFPNFGLWVACKTWNDAVKLWDMACQAGNVSILRTGEPHTTSAAVRASMLQNAIGVPAAQPHHHVSDSPVTFIPPPTAAPISSVSVVKIKFPSVIVISDSNSSDDSSEIEVTSQKAVEKKIDGSNLMDDKNSASALRQTRDATTDTCLGAPMKTKTSGRKAASSSSTAALKLCTSCPPIASGSGYKSPGTPPIAQTSQDPTQFLPSASFQRATKSKHSIKKSKKM